MNLGTTLALVAGLTGTPAPAPVSLQLAPQGNLLVLEVSPDDFAQMNVWDTDKLRLLLQKYSRQILARTGDKFDNVFFVMNQEEKPQNLYHGLNIPVSNAVRGIGKPVFSEAAAYGSGGKLKSVMVLTTRTAFLTGPLLHEYAHNWGNDMLETAVPGHWGFSSVGGQLGGFEAATLKQVGKDTYQASAGPFGGFSPGTALGNTQPYGALELYAMGLLDADKVPPIQVAQGAEMVDDEKGIFTATGFKMVTVADLIAKNGPRLPAPAQAQKEFRALAVLLTPRSAYPDEVVGVSAGLEQFSFAGDDGDPSYFNFWEATYGKARMKLAGVTLKP